MNPGAKVKLHGAQVGTVASIEDMPDGQAPFIWPSSPTGCDLIPANVAGRHRIRPRRSAPNSCS